MSDNDRTPNLTDLADGTVSGPEWEAWLAANPAAAEEVRIAQRVRALLLELQAAEIAVPADFEARLMERVRADKTLLDLFDLGLSGIGRTLLELLTLLFSLLPGPQPQPAVA